MAQNTDGEKSERTKSSEHPKSGSAAATRAGSASPAKGSRVLGQQRKQYLIAARRTGGFSPLGVPPLALNFVEQALRTNADVEVVDVLGPKTFVGALADGMTGSPHVIVALMDESKAAILHQQAQGQLIVEEDQQLALLDALLVPHMVTGRTVDATQLAVQVLVLGKDEVAIEGAEVYLYGGYLPAMGVTNNAGHVTLSLLGETAQSIRSIYVKPRGDYWCFYKSQPVIDPSQPNIVVLRPLSETYAELPHRQVMGWGQKAMRLDQVPPGLRGQGVKVAIIDSGANTNHQDLRALVHGFDAVGKKSGTNNWMIDTISHGTHCAGVIAGSDDNNVGIRGFAPAAEIHVCKVFPGGQVSQLVDALEYCIEQQVDVVNLNLGTEQVSGILQQELQRATGLGIACIVAAGNTGGPVQFPASSSNVLAVAAIGRVGEFPVDSYHVQTMQSPVLDGYFSPRFTCFGPEIALCAPGVAVLSSVPPNNFAAWDGTSTAAPHVTGLAALVLAHHPDFAVAFRARNLQRVQRLYQILKASARPLNLGDPRRTGFGLPDAPTALTLQSGLPGINPLAAYSVQQPYWGAWNG